MYYKDGNELYSVDEHFSDLFNLQGFSDNSLKHYGRGHLDGGHSGRYPWGSGTMPFQHGSEFLAKFRELSASGQYNGRAEIAKAMGLTSTQLDVQLSLARNRERSEKVQKAKDLYSQYENYTKVGQIMGISDNSVKSLLNSTREANMNKAENTANLLMDMMKEREAEGRMLEVGKGVAQELGISQNKLDEALYICYLNGYDIRGGGISTGPGKQTSQVVLCQKNSDKNAAYQFDKIDTVAQYHSNDGGETFRKLQPPKSIDSSRIMIRYGDEGGKDKDGVIELRRGVEDISLGGSNYAQVRIAVDDAYYLKGMAVYSDKQDSMPPGVDIIFNTNKKSGTPMMDGKEGVLKPMKTYVDENGEKQIDKSNPFSANIKSVAAGGQRYYIDENGKEQLSVINKVRDEGDWDKYSDNLASQFLVKQPLRLIERQLGQAYDEKKAELEEIKSYTNPTVKKKLLLTFADEADGASVDLKAAALPRQSWQVILPSTTLRDNEIYAPNYNTGEKVALVRYPHGGTFEIPILTVNNENRGAKKAYGQMKDAVAINSKVAERLSGADFDGDTVLVIPTNDRIQISSQRPLKGLEGFDPKEQYKIPYADEAEGRAHGYKYMKNTQNEMGRISNLITDMTLQGANTDELARAVRHSMVVIDAEKHGLDYTRSFKDNKIKELKDIYQGRITEDGKYSTGAATIISRAKSKTMINERKGNPNIDKYWDEKTQTWIPTGKNEGKLYYKESGREYLKIYDPVSKKNVAAYQREDGIFYKNGNNEWVKADKNAKVSSVRAQQEEKLLAVTDDAYKITSGRNNSKENAYADYSNKMKALAADARKEWTQTKDIEFDKLAKSVYINEYNSLNEKLRKAQSKAPRERAAQRKANLIAKTKADSNPEMSAGEYKKIKQRALEEARVEYGVIGGDFKIMITDKEWEAIQSGAINKSTLTDILNYADSTLVKKLAMPRKETELSNSVANKIRSYYNNGYTVSTIANQLGISNSTVYKYLDKDKEEGK